MQMANQERRQETMPARTLEFRQAMKDFRTMFPTLRSDLIECVLRSNGGHVDSTIDQLLQLSQDPNGMANFSRRHALLRGQRGINAYDDSTDSEDSIPSELLDPPTSSDDDIPVRDPPPMYTPRVGDQPNFFGTSYPVEVPVADKKKSSHKHSKSGNTQTKGPMKTYRSWNPPMLGTLPDDFLRILPQQFINTSTVSKERSSKKSSSSSKKRSPSNNHNSTRSSNSTPSGNRSFADKDTPVRSDRQTNSMDNTHNGEDDTTPPPRPPRTMPLPSSRRMPPHNDRNAPLRTEHIERGNLFIRPASDTRNFHHFPMDSVNASNGQRQRHHHRSSRSSHSNRCHNLSPSRHQNLPCATAATNGNHTRRSSDFASRRMVMVSRSSEPNMPVSHNEISGDLHSSINNERTSSSHHRSYQRSSSNSFNHHHATSTGQHSPVFQRVGSTTQPSQTRSSGRPSSATSSTRARPRTPHENEQYVEDWRLAILLQNEEFIRELKRNDDFLKALEKDRPRNADTSTSPASEDTLQNTSPDKNVVPIPDPDAKYPLGSQNPTTPKRTGMEDPEKDDEKAFKENLKHMGKSARKKFNDVAKKFSVRRKASYKSMKNIDPVFANCDDNFDEVPGPRSPVFDL